MLLGERDYFVFVYDGQSYCVPSDEVTIYNEARENGKSPISSSIADSELTDLWLDYEDAVKVYNESQDKLKASSMSGTATDINWLRGYGITDDVYGDATEANYEAFRQDYVKIMGYNEQGNVCVETTVPVEDVPTGALDLNWMNTPIELPEDQEIYFRRPTVEDFNYTVQEEGYYGRHASGRQLTGIGDAGNVFYSSIKRKSHRKP